MSYDEHLISQAGGDGELLDQIQRRITDCQSYKFGMRNADKLAHEDAPYLLALVREQAAKLEAVEKLIARPFASADKKHYEDDFNRGHVAGYNAAANLLRKAIDQAGVKP